MLFLVLVFYHSIEPLTTIVFQRTVWLPVPAQDSSQPPITCVPRDPVPSGLCSHSHISDMRTHMNIYIHIIKHVKEQTHMPRNVGDLKKPEKARKLFFPELSSGYPSRLLTLKLQDNVLALF